VIYLWNPDDLHKIYVESIHVIYQWNRMIYVIYQWNQSTSYISGINLRHISVESGHRFYNRCRWFLSIY